MGGAAAYYADIGKIHDQHYKELDNRAAEEHVISQSSTDGGRLDLHGVTVQQAVKIAREWVTRWWVEARIKEERKGRVNMNQVKPLVIVTGQGRHSKDGEAKVGPAVGKMLDREGWRWRSEGGNTGVLMVYGVKGK